MIDVVIHGEKTVRRAIGKQKRRLKSTATTAVHNWAKLTVSVARVYAPFATGALMTSGYAKLLGKTHAVMAFGARYAQQVEYTHPTHSLFLTRAINQTRGDFNAIAKNLFLAKRRVKRNYGVPDELDVGAVNDLRPGAA